MITPQSWPTDPRECHGLLSQYAQQVEDLQAASIKTDTSKPRPKISVPHSIKPRKLHEQTVQEHQQTIDDLRHQLDLYRRYVFGPRRERLTDAPGQGHLFEIEEPDLPIVPPETPAGDSKAPAKPRKSRKPDYDRLPQVRIEHDVPEAEKVCSHCGEHKARIGEDESHACCTLSRPTSSFTSTSCPSTPVPTAAMAWLPPSLRRVPSVAASPGRGFWLS